MGSTTAVDSLLVWVGPAGSKMFAAGNGSIWDVTTPGAVGAAAISGQTSDYWEAVQFSPTGDTSRVLIVNGLDAPQNYDGSVWATAPAITGLSAQPSFAWAYKNRIYVIENNTLNVWYLGLSCHRRGGDEV
jgi:hypothetical protein